MIPTNTPIDIEKLARLADRGLTLQEIADQMGHSYDGIRKCAKARGIGVMSKLDQQRAAATIDVDDDDLLAALRAHMPPLTSHDPGDAARVIGWAA